jgi:hypothetical protein
MNYIKHFLFLFKAIIFNKFIVGILALFLLTSNLKGQNIDSLLISGSYQNTSITVFFQQIEDNYPIKFYYNSEWVKDLKFSAIFNNKTLKSALSQIFMETPYIFESVQNGIILLPKEAVLLATGEMQMLTNGQISDDPITVGNIHDGGKSRKAIIKGTITSAIGNNIVIGAEIQVPNTKYGTISDNEGHFTIELPTGILNLKVNGIGFEEIIITVKLLSNGNLDIQLPEKSIKINEVVISGTRADGNVSSNQMSLVKLDRKQIKELPSINGTKDILKSMTMVAGVKSVGEFGSDINVRGGGGDQNLYLIEGTPVFNTAHIFGLFSVINSDIVNNLTLHKGDIPAKYGERISSIMDIDIKKEIPKKLNIFGGIGLIDGRLSVEAPIIKDKLSILLSGRSTYSDWLLTRLPDINLHNSKAQFYDLNGMVYWNLNPNNRISVFVYKSSDYFKYAKELNYSYGNLMGTAKWQHRFGQFLNSEISFHLSNYEVTKLETEQMYKKSTTSSNVNYLSAKLNFDYIKFENHDLEWGLETVFYKIDPGQLSPYDTLSSVVPMKLNPEQANESAVYFSDNYKINNKIGISLGLRVSAYSNYGPSKVYSYNPNQTKSTKPPTSVLDSTFYRKNQIISTFIGIEPRISIKYQINDQSSIKFNYNRNFQYISLVSYTSVFTPDDRWKLSDPFLKPTKCDQIALGYFKNSKDNSFVSSIEVYYKKISNLIEYKNGANLSMNPTIETELISAKGRNYGIELSIKKNTKQFDAMINYTWSRSLKKTDGIYQEDIINNNNYYASNYNKPHELNLYLTYHMNRRWRFSANFIYSTGRAATFPEMKYQFNNVWAIYYSDRNKYRLPDYHRLDLALSIDESLKLKKKWKGSWTFSVMNVYGRNNAYSVFYKNEEPTAQNNYKVFALYKLYIFGNPIPTITYNFKF